MISVQCFRTCISILNPSCTKVFGTHTFYKDWGGGGGGGGAGGEFDSDPHDLGHDRLYNLQFWQTIRTIYER